MYNSQNFSIQRQSNIYGHLSQQHVVLGGILLINEIEEYIKQKQKVYEKSKNKRD